MNLLALIVVLFSPRGGCTDEIVNRIDHAKRSVHVQAYAMTSEPIIQALGRAKMRHIDVQVLLDRGWQVQAPKAEPELIQFGIPVKIDAKHSIAHNKIIVIDGRIVITGSFNFTVQADRANAENLLVIRNTKTASLYEANFKAHADHCASP